jgi:branched-chain amino acid transport system substrate-binding protein
MAEQNRMYIIIAVVIIVAVGGYWLLTRQAPEEPNGTEERDIIVGIPLGFTGPYAALAEDSRDAMLLAIDEINHAGGILGHEIVPVFEDEENCEAGIVSSVFTKLITRENVDFIMTHFGNPSCSEYDIVEEYGIPYISGGFVQTAEQVFNDNPGKYKHVYLGQPSYSLYQTRFPEYVTELINNGEFDPINNKFCVIKRQNEYSLYIANGMRDNFLDMGWELTFDELFPEAIVEDWSSILAKIREDPPAVIINTMWTVSSDALFLEQFLADPTPSLLYLQSTPTFPDWQEIVGQSADGVIHCYGIKKVVSSDPYIIKYKQEYGRSPSPYGLVCYDYVYLMKQAMEIAGDPFDTEAVIEAFPKISYSGVMGIYEYDPNSPDGKLLKGGGAKIPFPMFQMWDVTNYMLYPEEVSEREFTLPPWYEGALEEYQTQ